MAWIGHYPYWKTQVACLTYIRLAFARSYADAHTAEHTENGWMAVFHPERVKQRKPQTV